MMPVVTPAGAPLAPPAAPVLPHQLARRLAQLAQRLQRSEQLLGGLDALLVVAHGPGQLLALQLEHQEVVHLLTGRPRSEVVEVGGGQQALHHLHALK